MLVETEMLNTLPLAGMIRPMKVYKELGFHWMGFQGENKKETLTDRAG
jgi:hypothetical protein